MTTELLCPQCGAPNLGTKFCEECGAPAPTASVAAAETPPALPESPPVATAGMPVPVPTSSSAVGATPARVFALLFFLLAGGLPGIINYWIYAAGNYLPEAAHITGDILVSLAGFFSFVAALAGRASATGKLVGALLALVYIGLTIYLLYGGVQDFTGYTNYLLIALAYFSMFLSWGLGRPFRGPGYFGLLILLFVGFLDALVIFIPGVASNYAGIVAIETITFALSVSLVVGLSVAFEGKPPGSAVAFASEPQAGGGLPPAHAPAPSVHASLPKTAPVVIEPRVPSVAWWDRPRSTLINSAVIGGVALIIVVIIAASTISSATSLDAQTADAISQPIESAAGVPTPEPSASVVSSRIPKTCAALFSAATSNAIQAAGYRPGTSAHLSDPAGTSDPTLASLLARSSRLECTWHPSDTNTAGIETSVLEVDPSTTAAVAARVQALGYASLDELGGVRYFFEATGSDGVHYGESDMLRDGLWFATRWVQYGPDGYTADMVKQVFG